MRVVGSLSRIALLVVAATVIWLVHFDRWTVDSWRVPTDYTGDSHETLARLKAASEGAMRPLAPQIIPRLGAPFGAYWNAYPTPDKPLMTSLGVLVRVIGVNAAANVGMLLAQITAALAFYFVARWMRCDWRWAACGALLFAYSYHTFHRGLAHFSLIFTWTVPLGLLAAWLIAQSKRLEWRTKGAAVCIGAAIALGTSNPYNLFFWLQLMAWAVLMQYFTDRRRANLQIGLLAIALAIACFVAVNAEVWLHVQDKTAIPLLARNYGGTERYALKPVEMFIPPEYHRWGWLAFFGHRYIRWSEWRGEVFLPYLGLVGVAGFGLLTWQVVRAALRRKPLPGYAYPLGWLLAFATIGGVTNLLAFFAQLQVFRATNRVAIFISAIVLLFLAIRVSRWTAHWPKWAVAVVASAVAAFGIADQIPRADPQSAVAAIAEAVHADEQFGAALEARLPADAMVFQLPVLGFPEVIPPYRLDSYEHFRPYLTTNRVRFTYGTPKFRSRGRWQRELEAMPTAQMVSCLEQYGFAAIYINRKGYADRGAALLAALGKLGYRTRIEGSSGHQVAVLLRPVSQPILPLAHSFSYGYGWYAAKAGPTRWSSGDAALSYFNPYPHPLSVQVSLTMTAVTARDVALQLEGRTIRQMNVGATSATVVVDNVQLHPGVNHFTLQSATGPVRLGNGPNQLRAVGLQTAVVRPAPLLDPLKLTPDGVLAGVN